MAKWYDEAIFYHIYPLGLTGAPKENKEDKIEHRFEEIDKWIPHMKELNITATYIGPLFESTTHGYDTKDYKEVDRRLGDNDDFKRFVKLCHESGIKVVVDGVFNHTGREFFAFLDVKEKRESSQYRYWYRDLNFGGNTGYNDGFSYAAWRGCYELVNLNLDNREVRDYILEVIKYWIEEFDVDGIRLDCADCLPFDFMKEMRAFTAGLKEDFWLMGEVIHGDYGKWANNETLHSVTDYELHKGLYSGHNDHNYFEIAHTVRRLFDENGGICKDSVLYSFADNHDVDRLASKLNNKEHLYNIYTLIYTLPGIPSIYYGSEWGIEGKKEGSSDDPLRPCIDIADKLVTENNLELTKYLCELGKIKLENNEYLTGRYKELVLTNRQFAFARYTQDGAVITVLNCDDNAANVKLNLNFGIKASAAVNLFTDEEAEINNNELEVKLEPNRGVLLLVK